MDRVGILQEIEAQIQLLRQARELLAGNSSVAPNGQSPQTRNGVRSKAITKQAGGAIPKRKRVMSEEARQRIVAAQKRRWAAHRKTAKKKAAAAATESPTGAS